MQSITMILINILNWLYTAIHSDVARLFCSGDYYLSFNLRCESKHFSAMKFHSASLQVMDFDFGRASKRLEAERKKMKIEK